MTPDLCPHCGQALPNAAARLTDRELDVLTAWWMAGSLVKAAVIVGVGQQRAKNMMRTARIRNRVETNQQLLAVHFAVVRSKGLDRMQHKMSGSAAA